MPAYDSLMQLLRTLHHLQMRLADLQGRLAKNPRIIATQEQRVRQYEAAHATLAAEQQRLTLAARDQERQLNTAEQAIVKRKQQLLEAKNNKEYQALQSQITHDQESNARLADVVLEAMEAAEAFEPKVAAATAERQQAVVQRDNLVAQFAAEKPGIERDLAQFTAELRKQESHLPRPFREVYDRIAASRGETEVLTVVTGQSFCGECNNQVPINQLAQMMSQQPIACISCTRLLYLPEGYVFDKG